MDEKAPKTRVPVTLNWRKDDVVGYADVNMETGEVVLILNPADPKVRQIRNMLHDGELRAFSVAFEADVTHMSHDKFRRIKTDFEMEDVTLRFPHQSEGLGDV